MSIMCALLLRGGLVGVFSLICGWAARAGRSRASQQEDLFRFRC
jgi:hypothetical protein